MRAGADRASDLLSVDVVLVEQVATLHTDEGDKVSCVFHLFTVVDNRIARIRTYRYDAGLPSG